MGIYGTPPRYTARPTKFVVGKILGETILAIFPMASRMGMGSSHDQMEKYLRASGWKANCVVTVRCLGPMVLHTLANTLTIVEMVMEFSDLRAAWSTQDSLWTTRWMAMEFALSTMAECTMELG